MRKAEEQNCVKNVKDVSDMGRYIDTDLIPYSDDDDYLSQYAYRYDIDEVPTADVVPKSEVEKLLAKLSESITHLQETIAKNGQRTLEVILEETEKAKAEVAREIFEEIESVCLKHIDRYDRYLMCCKEFAELKKKYTGNENG